MLPGQHRSRLAHIPAHVVTGGSGAAKTRILRRLLELRPQPPQGERWAVLVTETDGAGLAHEGVHISSVTVGCICCSGSVELRTTLTRLLREARPDRVLIEAPASARSGELLRLLQDQWLAPVLDLRAVILVLNDNEPREAKSDADREWRQQAGIVVCSTAVAVPPNPFTDMPPGATLIAGPQEFTADLLDLPGPGPAAPRFHSGEPP